MHSFAANYKTNLTMIQSIDQFKLFNSQYLLLKNGNVLPLQVGMSLKANIKLRKISYLQLLLGSFRDKTESLKSI